MSVKVIRRHRAAALIGMLPGILLGLFLGIAMQGHGWAAERLSKATEQLFDAVWAGNLGKVKSSLAAGAKLEAINEFGARPVDLAVDKGHYDIAHYLLSVDKLRRDAQVENLASSGRRPDPVAGAQQPVIPAPSVVVSAEPVTRPNIQATTPPAAPVARPASTFRAMPVPPPEASPQKEQLWSPEGTDREPVPHLKISKIAEPVQVTPEVAKVASQPEPQAAGVVRPANSKLKEDTSGGGWFDKVTDFLKPKETAGVQDMAASPVPVEPKTPAQTASEPAVKAAESPPAPEVAAITEKRGSESPGVRVKSDNSADMAVAEKPGFLDQITNMFKGQAQQSASAPAVEPTPAPAPEKVATSYTVPPGSEPAPAVRRVSPPVPAPAVEAAVAAEPPAVETAVRAVPAPPPAPEPARAISADEGTSALGSQAKTGVTETAAQKSDRPGFFDKVTRLFGDQGKPAGPAVVEQAAQPRESASTPQVSGEAEKAWVPAPENQTAQTPVVKPSPEQPASMVIEQAVDSVTEPPAAPVERVVAEASQQDREQQSESVPTEEPADETSVRDDVVESVVSSAPAPVQDEPGFLDRFTRLFGEQKESVETAVNEPVTEPAVSETPSKPVSDRAASGTMGPAPAPTFQSEPQLVSAPTVAPQPESAAEKEPVPEPQPTAQEPPEEVALSEEPEDETSARDEGRTPLVSHEVPSTVETPGLLDRFTRLFGGEKNPVEMTANEPAAEPAPLPEPKSVSSVPEVAEQVPTINPEIEPQRVPEPVVEATPENPEAVAEAVPDSPPVIQEAPKEAAQNVAPEDETSARDEGGNPLGSHETPLKAETPGLFDRFAGLFGGNDESVETAGNEPAPDKGEAPEIVATDPPAVEVSADSKLEPVAEIAPPETEKVKKTGLMDRLSGWLKPEPKPSPELESTGPAEPAKANVNQVVEAAEQRVAESAPRPTQLAAQQEAALPPAKADVPQRVPSGPDPSGHRKVMNPATGMERNSTLRAADSDRPPLKGIVLKIGDGGQLGLPEPKSEPRRDLCVDKSRWNTLFCIEPVAWPKSVAPHFRVSTTYYRGQQAIVQYHAGRATQYHALFPTKALRDVTAHFTAKYGPPTEHPEIWTALIGAPKRPNRTVRWRSRKLGKDAGSTTETILEIREIDDLRWSSPPDVKHGVVRLYEQNSGSVFELLSATDLLLVNIRRRGS